MTYAVVRYHYSDVELTHNFVLEILKVFVEMLVKLVKLVLVMMLLMVLTTTGDEYEVNDLNDCISLFRDYYRHYANLIQYYRVNASDNAD